MYGSVTTAAPDLSQQPNLRSTVIRSAAITITPNSNLIFNNNTRKFIIIIVMVFAAWLDTVASEPYKEGWASAGGRTV